MMERELQVKPSHTTANYTLMAMAAIFQNGTSKFRRECKVKV